MATTTHTVDVDVPGELAHAVAEVDNVLNSLSFEAAAETPPYLNAAGIACHAFELLELASRIAAGTSEPVSDDRLAVYDVGRWAIFGDFGTGPPTGKQVATLLRMLDDSEVER